jgi:hypothetical protein
MKKFAFTIILGLAFAIQLSAQLCSQRPTFQIGYNGVTLNSFEGTLENVYGTNGYLCAAGVYLDCKLKSLTFTTAFPILTNRIRVKYYVELYEVNSTQNLTGLTYYNLIAQSNEVTISDHYFQSTQYVVVMNVPVKPGYTYRARMRYKTRLANWLPWSAFWSNTVSNSWNVYSPTQATYNTCPFGNYDSANCYVMDKPANGFIYNNCFYVLPSPGNTCPIGTSYDGANCLLMNKPANGFIYANNFYVPKNSNGSCPPGTNDDSANCVVFLTPWGHNAFEYQGKWYVTPLPSCPQGFSYDGANCYYNCAPCGRTAFEYQGKWYYTYKN